MNPTKKMPKPWEGASKTKVKPFQLRPNEYEHAYLHYFGGTTYGETMHSIAMAAIRKEIERLCKEQGLEPPVWE